MNKPVDRDWQAEARYAKRDLALNPKDAEARDRLFWSLVHLGRIDDARVEGERLSGQGSASLPVIVELAKIEIQTGHPEKAVELLRPRWREDSTAAAVLAWAFDALGKSTLAEFVRSEIRGVGAPGGRLSGRVYFGNQLIGLLRTCQKNEDPRADELIDALEDGRFAEAGTYFFRWIAQDPRPSVALLARADWAMLTGNVEEADTLLRSYSVDSDYAADVENRLGDIARLGGRLSEARAHWKRAVVLRSNDWNAWMDLIHAEVTSGSTEQAEALCERVLELDPPEEVRWTIEATRSSDVHSASGASGVYVVAWTEKGGGVLPVQCEVTRSRQGLVLTGHTGWVLEESARVAFEYLHREEGAFEAHGVHLHFPDMRSMVDGASAGLALVTIMWARATGMTLSHSIALTGQIGLAGEVYEIGGLREKLIAAHLSGIDLCVIPAQNSGDLVWLPASVRRDLRIIPVASFRDVKEIL